MHAELAHESVVAKAGPIKFGPSTTPSRAIIQVANCSDDVTCSTAWVVRARTHSVPRD